MATLTAAGGLGAGSGFTADGTRFGPGDGSLFGAQTPALTDAADGSANYTLGTRFVPAVDGTVTHAKWRFPNTTPSASVPVSAGLYRVSDQALLGSTVFDLATPAGVWNAVPFSTPIPVTAGQTYVIAVWTPLRYVATASYPWPVTSGNLTAPAANGWLAVNPGSLSYPSVQSGNAASYFADVVFTGATAAGTATLAASGGITAGATVTAGTTVPLPATGALTGTATSVRTVSAALAATGTLTSAATGAGQGSAALTGFGGISAAAAADRASTGLLPATGGLTGTGTVGRSGTTSLPASGALTAAGSSGSQPTVVFDAVSTMPTTAGTTSPGSATLAGIAALTTASTANTSTTTVFPGIAALAAATTYRRRPGRLTPGTRRPELTAGGHR